MFLTKFIRKDHRPDEDYWYHTADEALNHLNLFVSDDSNLFERIIVSDEGKNAVLQILIFDDNGNVTSFKEGDVVRLKPEWCSEGERKYIYAITNLNDRTMRCYMTCLNSGSTIHGSELVGLDMISPVGTTIEEILQSNKKTEQNQISTLTCEGCLDYDDCPYHEPSDYTPYLEDDSIGCPFNLAKKGD